MTCPNCGRFVPDGTQCSCMNTEMLLSSNPVVHTLKKIGSSPMFLIATICYTLAIGANILYALFSNSSAVFDYTYTFNSYGNGMEQLSNIGSVIISNLGMALVALAMWLLYTSSCNRSNGGLNTAGLTIYKVVLIIRLVFMILATVLMVVAGVLVAVMMPYLRDELMSSFSYYSYYSDLPAELIAGMAGGMIAVVLFIVAAFLILYIVYTALAIKTVNRIKQTALTGVANSKVSGFVIAMGYIFAVLSGLQGVYSLLLVDVFSGLSTLLSAVSLFLVMLCLSKYKKAAVWFSQQTSYQTTPVANSIPVMNVAGYPQQNYAQPSYPVNTQQVQPPVQQMPSWDAPVQMPIAPTESAPAQVIEPQPIAPAEAAPVEEVAPIVDTTAVMQEMPAVVSSENAEPEQKLEENAKNIEE